MLERSVSMKYFDRIKRAFTVALGKDAEALTPASDMENLKGWDSAHFIALVVAVENEFSIEMSTLDAASLTSIEAIDAYLQRKLNG